MLVALHHALDRRFGLTPEERKHFRQVYGDPWVLVRDLLGHKSEQTGQRRVHGQVERPVLIDPNNSKTNGTQLRDSACTDADQHWSLL